MIKWNKVELNFNWGIKLQSLEERTQRVFGFEPYWEHLVLEISIYYYLCTWWTQPSPAHHNISNWELTALWQFLLHFTHSTLSRWNEKENLLLYFHLTRIFFFFFLFLNVISFTFLTPGTTRKFLGLNLGLVRIQNF